MLLNYLWAALVALLFSTNLYANSDLNCDSSCGAKLGPCEFKSAESTGPGVYKCIATCNVGTDYEEDVIAGYIGCSPCDLGEINPLTGQCEGGCTSQQMEIIGPNGSTVCADIQNPDGDCENIVGYINGDEVCGDKQDECNASGGSLGQVNGETVCVPSDLAPPECASAGGLVMVDEGYVCESPSDNENGTDNEENTSGADPDTALDPQNPIDSTDVDPSTLTDPVDIDRNNLKEQQEQSTELRKQTNQLGDINDELNAQTDLLSDISSKLGEEPGPGDDPATTPQNMPDNLLAPNTISEAHENFKTAIYASPLVAAFDDMSNIVPDSGGQCPTLDYDFSDTIIGITTSVDLHCELLESVASELYAIMLVVYTWYGFRILART